ncbi:MAG: putative aminohydrolase SsnA [Spirochaetia bacterium]|nr:putative aminohydrolase SsnA [Spirochaetia bacterium]MCF7946805.1 putative aminohydrolase SsnA [Spirochaetia bacterium]
MIIIKNIDAMQFDPPAVLNTIDVVIKGHEIYDIGKDAAESYIAAETDTIIDGTGLLLYPGLVCSHHHFYSGLSRGILANIEPTPDFISILKNLWWKLDRTLDEEAIYYSSLICSLDAIASGTTAVIDHHASPHCISGSLREIKRSFEKTGLRGMTCYEVSGRNSGEDEIKNGIDENVSFARMIDEEKSRDEWSGLVEASVGGHAPFTISNTGLSALKTALDTTKRGLHIHVGEGKYDASWSHHHYGQDLIKRLDDFGLLDSKSIVVHGVHLSGKEIEILNEKNAFLVHNARSNMNNGIGYNNKLNQVKNTALGTDGIGANMFEEFKHAFFKHKDAGGPLWPDDYLKFLSNGNEILNRYFPYSFGKLEKGYAADVVIADYRSPTPLSKENIAGHMTFGMSSDMVRTVIIHGSLVMNNREFPFDTAPIYEKAQKIAVKLWDKMNSL